MGNRVKAGQASRLSNHQSRNRQDASPAFARPVFSWLNLLGRFVLAAVFMVAGGLKIGDPIGFARNIVDYDLVPELFVPMIAVVLPWWEVAAAALAVAGRWKVGALTALTGMSGAFLILGAITLARGLSVECGCFGFFSERVGLVSISIEAALLAMSVFLLRWELSKNRQE